MFLLDLLYALLAVAAALAGIGLGMAIALRVTGQR